MSADRLCCVQRASLRRRVAQAGQQLLCVLAQARRVHAHTRALASEAQLESTISPAERATLMAILATLTAAAEDYG